MIEIVILYKFNTSHTKKGNNIIKDDWLGYNFLDQPSSGYTRFAQIRVRDFLD